MNVFLIDKNPIISASMLTRCDPVRARKQLLEGCQILASVERALLGETTMLRADGQPYRAAHPHHPCVTHCLASQEQLDLVIDVTACLALKHKGHACATSFGNWDRSERCRIYAPVSQFLVVVRRGHPHQFVRSRAVYADMMLAYLRETKWFPPSSAP